jgi:DnaK suppressor protein
MLGRSLKRYRGMLGMTGREIDERRLRQRLEERRDALQSTAQTGREAADTVTLDQSKVGRLSRMDALQAQAMSQEGERRREQELRQIDAALERLESGDYGYCLACDEPIATARLELNPAVTLCIGCAEERERR